MRITLSESAAAELEKKRGDQPGSLRLVYDTEGCGCAVNGVPTLWITDAPASGDVSAAGQQPDVWIDPKHAIFFEDDVKLDYRSDSRSFRLHSVNQIYNAALKIIDHREMEG